MKEEIRRYYRKTKMKRKSFTEIKESEIPETWEKVFYKTYPRFPSKKITGGNVNENVTALINFRISTREFTDIPLTYEELSNILYWSAGKKQNSEYSRMYPSAGARYPVEIYLVSRKTERLENGLYHLNIKDNSLEQLLNKDLDEEIDKIILQDELKKAAAIIFMTGVISRSEVKYGANAYRFALIESGHIGQNIHLIAEQQNIGCCAIGGFDNDNLAKLLDITGSEIPLYALALGKRK